MLEVLQDFKSVAPPLEWLLQTVPRLRPRLFSISSSLRSAPEAAHVTAAIVDWQTPLKRRRQVQCRPASCPGYPVCSCCSDDVHKKVGHARCTCFHMRRVSAPPGWQGWTLKQQACGCQCGCSAAPFTHRPRRRCPCCWSAQGPAWHPSAPSCRTAKCSWQQVSLDFPHPGDFVQLVHWRASKVRFRGRSLTESAGVCSTGGSQGPVHLFFGCRNAEGDFLYREELEAFLPTGVLVGLHVACSRDKPEKLYVTHLIRQQAALVWQLLQQVRQCCEFACS